MAELTLKWVQETCHFKEKCSDVCSDGIWSFEQNLEFWKSYIHHHKPKGPDSLVVLLLSFFITFLFLFFNFFLESASLLAQISWNSLCSLSGFKLRLFFCLSLLSTRIFRDEPTWLAETWELFIRGLAVILGMWHVSFTGETFSILKVWKLLWNIFRVASKYYYWILCG